MPTVEKETLSFKEIYSILKEDGTPNKPDEKEEGDLWEKLPEYGETFLKEHGEKLGEVV